MRLSNEIVNHIIEVLDPYFVSTSSSSTTLGSLFLFGSRVEDNLKGGDIDLLILTDQIIKKKLTQEKHVIISKIHKKIGERKVDLLISSKIKEEQEVFIQEILKKAICLQEWTY